MYSHAPAMHNAPTTINHGALVSASTRPAAAPTLKLTTATANTERGAANREPTSRTGPARSSSVPRMPSE